MGFRITTNMMMNTYRYNLQGSTKKLSDARDMVMTQRAFGSYAEDPAAATLSFRLRRDYYKTTSYLNNTKDVYSKFNTAWNNLTGVVEELSDTTARVASIRGNNGTAGESRSALAVVLRETSESVIHAMNQKLGDHFIFAGNDALNVPFSWDGETLLYRGVNVNAGSMEKPAVEVPAPADMKTLAAAQAAVGGTWSSTDTDWYNYYTHATDTKPAGTEPAWLENLVKSDTTLTEAEQQKWLDYYKHDRENPPMVENVDTWGPLEKGETYPKNLPNTMDPAWDEETKDWFKYYNDQRDVTKLEAMANEEMYIDLGMGAAESSPNNPVKGTYFNSALSGVDFTGYGVDEDGDPKNLALIMRELADVFETWDEDMDPQGYNPSLAKNSAKGLSSEELEAKAFRLMDKLKAAQEHTTEKWTELDANSVYLQTSEKMLTVQKSDLNLQILDVEQVDLADAITTFSWQQYCYNAALKIGNQLLSQSLIDYMS